MQKLLKEIKKEVKTQIKQGEDPQTVYDTLSTQYEVGEKDVRFLHRFIAKRIRNTVLPENRKEFSFSYHLYLISLWFAFIITLISKQHRIEALGLISSGSLSAWGAFVLFNLFAWIYLILAIRSLRFNLSAAYWALFFSAADMIRLLTLFPVYWIETPFFSILRIIPTVLVFIFGVFYVINCSNPFSENRKTGAIAFYRTKKKFHLGQPKTEN